MTESKNDDEKFDAFLARDAKDYNAPSGEVPRAEMWSAISGARASRGHEHGAGPVASGRRPFRFAALAGTLAATLIIGVAIGKYALGGGIVRTGATTDSALLAHPSAVNDSTSGSFSVAAADHLSRAEALLTTYELSRGDTTADLQIATWARDVLSDTRLLLDSPAAADPLRKRLLADLEIVLVQMVQRAPPDGARDERTHITRTMQRTHVLTRLRSAQQSGPNRGT